MATVTSADLYGRIHKGLRKTMFDLAYQAGRTDYTNTAEWESLKADTKMMIHFLNRHGDIEDTFLLPLLEAQVPGITKQDSEDHEEVHRQLHAIEEEMARIDSIESADERRTIGESFYLMLNGFIADYLGHMHHEEVNTTPLFFEHCSDQDLLGALGKIIASNAPSDTMMMLQHTIPAIDPADRAYFLGNIRRSAPPPAFAAIMNTVQGVLNENEWTRLQADLA